MRAVVYVACFVAALWIPFVAADGAARAPKGASAIDALAHAHVKVALLLLFNAVNALICVWEIALWTHRHDVRRMHREYLRKFGKRVRTASDAARGGGRRRRVTDGFFHDDAAIADAVVFI